MNNRRVASEGGWNQVSNTESKGPSNYRLLEAAEVSKHKRQITMGWRVSRKWKVRSLDKKGKKTGKVTRKIKDKKGCFLRMKGTWTGFQAKGKNK